MNAIKSALVFGCCAATSVTLARADEIQWAQVHVVMRYQRTGTIATAPEGHFSYQLTATLDEVMQQVPSNDGQRPDYVVPDGYTKSFSLHGTHQLVGEVTQTDKNTGKTYIASAKLSGSISKPEEFWLERVSVNPVLGDGYGAELKVAAPLTGSFKSTYPQMPDALPEEGVLLFPSPVKFDKSSNAFVSEGPIEIFPVLGTRPSDPTGEVVYDAAAASENLPTLGGIHPPSIGAITTGAGDHWQMILKKKKNFDTLTGGSYTDSISLEISVGPSTLPLPKQFETTTEN